MKLKRSIGLAFVALLSLPGMAQVNLTAPIPTNPDVKIGKLPNGLTYYIQRNPKPEKKVELRLAINAGSVLENKDQLGLAHFMEHMNFNGSKNFPKNELVSYLQQVGVKFGADLNAYTSFDETVYILPISTDNPEVVEKGFTVLEDWAFNNLLDKSEIDKERGVVLEESRLNKNAQDRLRAKFFPRLFNGSLYASRLPIGSDSVLKNFSYATLERFYRNWYRPNLMAVVVVGDIDPAEAEKKIKAHFSSFKNPANAPVRPAIIPIKPRTTAEAMVLTDDELPNATIQMISGIKPAKKVKTWADYRDLVIRDLVNNMLNQRLQELSQKENPPFLQAFSGNDELIRGYDASFGIAVLGSGTTKDAINALISENERVRRFGFLATELERAKAEMLNAAEEDFKEKDKLESGRIVNDYVTHFLSGDPIPGVENHYKFVKSALPAITLADINKAAKAMAPSSSAFVLVQAPSSMKDKLPTNGQLLGEIVAATKQDIKPYSEKAVTADLGSDNIKAGQVVSETTNAKLNTTTYTLNNGVTVTIKPTTLKNDEIRMNARRLGGWHRFPLEKMENASAAAQMVMTMGVKDMSPTDLKKFLSGKTVQVVPSLDEHVEGIQGSSSVKDFETMLQLTNLYLTEPRKDPALLNAFVNNIKGILGMAMNDPNTFYQDTLNKIMYNSSPWMIEIPTAAQLEKINADETIDIYKQIFGNAHGMHFTFVGSIDPAKAKPMIEKYLGSLPAQPMERAPKDNGIRPIKGVYTANIKKGKEAQSLINFKWTGETEYKREENLHLRALLEVMNISVIEKLREEIGGMYSGGLDGSIIKHPYGHYEVEAYIPCGPENVEKLSAALLDIVKRAQEGKIEAGDLAKVKETMKKEYQTNIQQNAYWLGTLSDAKLNGTDPELALNFEARVDALTIEDLTAAAKKFLNMNNYVRAVLYPESAQVEGGVKKTF